MLAALLLAAAGTLVAASPMLLERQSFSTDPNAACGLQPFGYGLPSGDDNSFEANPVYQFAALAAPAPKDYTVAFRNATGSTQQAGYMGYYVLEVYNTTQCAGFCNSASGCEAFNLYFERDPLLNPADGCSNPVATTNIKCTLWSQDISLATATNQGQYRDQFHVVIAGSDGFNHQ